MGVLLRLGSFFPVPLGIWLALNNNNNNNNNKYRLILYTYMGCGGAERGVWTEDNSEAEGGGRGSVS